MHLVDSSILLYVIKENRFGEGEIIDLHRIIRDMISSVTFCNIESCRFFSSPRPSIVFFKVSDTAMDIMKVASQEEGRNTTPEVVNSTLP